MLAKGFLLRRERKTEKETDEVKGKMEAVPAIYVQHPHLACYTSSSAYVAVWGCELTETQTAKCYCDIFCDADESLRCRWSFPFFLMQPAFKRMGILLFNLFLTHLRLPLLPKCNLHSQIVALMNSEIKWLKSKRQNARWEAVKGRNLTQTKPGGADISYSRFLATPVFLL